MKQDLFGQFENIPCFSKTDLRLVFWGSENALNEQVKRAIKNKKILLIKKGLYVSYLYWLKEANKTGFLEFIASKLRYPSYLSLEYVLSKNNLLTEATYPFTSVTTKSNRTYQNSLGVFRYSSIKQQLFKGFQKQDYAKNSYFIANPAKALFDWLYLKKNLRISREEILEELRINWENFSKKDFLEFNQYIRLSGSKKMARIGKILSEGFYANK